MECDRWSLSRLTDSIAEFYYSSPNPRYVLLVGDDIQIPAYSLTVKDPPQWTPLTKINDNAVCCIQSREYSRSSIMLTELPDMCPGRIPFSDPNEVSHVLSMIKQYEMSPPTNSDFYNKAMLAASFEADENAYPLDQSCEYLNFIKISESEARFLTDNNKEIKRVYNSYIHNNVESLKPITPTYYSLNYPYSFNNSPMLLPSFLRNPSFNWNSDTTSFLTNMNQFLLVYNGHGHITSFGMPGHVLFQVPSTLSNGRNRPFVLRAD